MCSHNNFLHLQSVPFPGAVWEVKHRQSYRVRGHEGPLWF